MLCPQLTLSLPYGTNSPTCFRKDGAGGKAQNLGSKLTQPPKLHSRVKETDNVPEQELKAEPDAPAQTPPLSPGPQISEASSLAPIPAS